MEEAAQQQSVTKTIDLMGEIISAYVARNHVQAAELPSLIANVYAALNDLNKEPSAEPAGPEKPSAAAIRNSIKPDGIVSFEDGKIYQTLRRHLTKRALTPETYRTKWGLPVDYPITSAAYSAQRSELARSSGLGQQRKKASSEAAEGSEPA